MSESDDAFLKHKVGGAFVKAKPGHIGVAVSGGGDSMALLLLLQEWASANGARLSAVTLDHGLRPEAAEEAAFVARACADRGIPHQTLLWQGKAAEGNLQAEARAARYCLIAEWAVGLGIDTICLGHTRDDQAETVLMRLARKAGSDGLRGMADHFERHGVSWVRPLLGLDRAALRAFLERRETDWVEDPSNEDMDFERIKARKALACLGPLGIDAGVLGAVAANLQSENDFLRRLFRRSLSGKVLETLGALCIDRAAFELRHPEAFRRFIASAVQWIGNAKYPPRAESQQQLEIALLNGKAHTVGGVIGFVSKEKIWLARELQAVKDARGNPFDYRWRIEGPLEGVEIRALGDEGLKQWHSWREIGVPRRVLLSLPSIWKGDELVAIPHDPAENRYKASLITTSFENWLQRH